ncbi:DUF3298 and DUF4163 domain-containing protein [Mangrovimonas cancribranchiae]|uniref:DUF4163 domain-containing protein n=1 Tax=Mangrovimonas cancribranchiae TaxID=3080055 RepID=A0AAU6P7Y3_9FLAO
MIKRLAFLSLLALLTFSCEEDISITFEGSIISPKTTADIDILYPKAKENHTVAKQINNKIEHYIAQQINFKDTSNTLSIKEVISKFDNELKQFKADFPETPQEWEVNIEGEVLLQTPEIICIGMSSYMYTGGAHGNDRIDFLNFDTETGKLMAIADLITNIDGFSKLVETHLKKEIETNKNDTIENYFFGQGFTLPESFGFNDIGVIILYNQYEIASYAQGITEFVIPYNEAEPFLKIMPL